MAAAGTSIGTVELTWSPPESGPSVDHYVISARAAAEHFYRTRRVVSGYLTSASVDVSQDLGIPPATPYYVSIAAVDAAGHESLYAYPEYRCNSKNTCREPADALNVTAIATSTAGISGLTYNGGTPFINGTTLTKGTTYTVKAQTNSKTESVVFTRDGSVVSVDSETPFAFTWAPTLVGSHTFTVTPWSSTEGKGIKGASTTVKYLVVAAAGQ
jgi:hypothetical protein